jgi:hypothetical protein
VCVIKAVAFFAENQLQVKLWNHIDLNTISNEARRPMQANTAPLCAAERLNCVVIGTLRLRRLRKLIFSTRTQLQLPCFVHEIYFYLVQMLPASRTAWSCIVEFFVLTSKYLFALITVIHLNMYTSKKSGGKFTQLQVLRIEKSVA